MTEILILCTANACRSVMAAALLAHRLATAGVAASVRSAGMLSDGEPPPPEVVSAMASRGLDVSAHRSRRIGEDGLRRTDLVLAMAREHLRYAVVTAPQVWPRALTLKELVRRGELAGPRRAGLPFADWLSLLHEGRDRSALLGDCPADDVADPIGGPPEAYIATALQLDHLLGQLVALAWGPGSPRAAD
jgi:protein-tyrosine phosphatase